MTASLAPRMNVDNCLKVFKYNGLGPVLKVDYERAFDAMWKPVPVSVYPNRPPSPRRGGAEGQPVVAPPKATIAAAAPYRPPGSSGSLASFMRETSSSNAPVGKVKKDSGSASSSGGKFVPSAQNRTIPGMAPPSKGPQQRTIPGAPPAAPKQQNNAPKQNNNSTGATTKAPAAQKAPAPAPVPIPVQPPQPPAEETAESKEKRAKAISKKLKQIQELKAKAASGQALDAEQVRSTSKILFF